VPSSSRSNTALIPFGRAAIGAAIAGHITVGAADNLRDPAGFVSAGAFGPAGGKAARAFGFGAEVHRSNPSLVVRSAVGPQYS
jgi:hypothetical protein